MEEFKFNLVTENPESTVVAKYMPSKSHATTYQSEAELEHAFIDELKAQAYEYLSIASEEDLIANLRRQLERLNDFSFQRCRMGSLFCRRNCQSKSEH